MKKTILTILLVLFTTTCYASFKEDFNTNFDTQGIEVAVSKALEEGVGPFTIVEYSLTLEGLNPQNTLKALYCEGVEGEDIKNAAFDNGVSELILIASFEKSIAECGDAVADSQAYTPVAKGLNFAGMPAPTNGSNRSFASPSTFN